MANPDLSDVVLDFADTLTVTRAARVTYSSAGDPVSASTSTLTVQATWQPATGRDLRRVPEGLRTEEGVVLFSTSLLRAGGGTYEPDVVTIEAESYQVATVERWGSYWRAVAVKVGAQ
jgi:hypothetical protein